MRSKPIGRPTLAVTIDRRADRRLGRPEGRRDRCRLRRPGEDRRGLPVTGRHASRRISRFVPNGSQTTRGRRLASSPTGEDAEPPEISEGVRLLATQMSVAGSGPSEIAQRLRDEFGVENSAALVRELFGQINRPTLASPAGDAPILAALNSGKESRRQIRETDFSGKKGIRSKS